MPNKLPEPQGQAMPTTPARVPEDRGGKEPAARRACINQLSFVKVGTDNSLPQPGSRGSCICGALGAAASLAPSRGRVICLRTDQGKMHTPRLWGMDFYAGSSAPGIWK